MPINPEKYDFLEGLEANVEFIFEGLKIAILEEIVIIMKAKGISRAELARRLGTSRAYVTRMLRANVNFTLMSLVQIKQALGIELTVHFQIPDIRVAWLDKVEKEIESQREPLSYSDKLGEQLLPNRSKNAACTNTA